MNKTPGLCQYGKCKEWSTTLVRYLDGGEDRLCDAHEGALARDYRQIFHIEDASDSLGWTHYGDRERLAAQATGQQS